MNGELNRPPETMASAMKRTRTMWRSNLLITLALVAAAILFMLLRGGGMRLELLNDTLRITAPDGSVTRINYYDIASAEAVENPDYGTCIEGEARASCWYGTWESDAWGRYRLCVDPRVPACVLIDTAVGRYALNQSSARDTELLAEYLNGVVEARQGNG